MSIRIQGVARQRAITLIDVRHYGAWGDGAHDDTRAIACALEALGPRGGTLAFPPGDYAITPSTLVVPSRVRLTSSDPANRARIIALPSRAGREWMLLVSGVEHEITDLVLIGNRTDGQGTEDERGHGIYIQGAHGVSLARLHIEQCWGDGISVGAGPGNQPAEDIWIEDVVS